MNTQDTTRLIKPRFTFLTGDVNWKDYGAKWISQRMNNGEFDFWYVVELLNMDDACGRDNFGQPKYNVCLSVVSPQEAGPDNMSKAADSCGWEGMPDTEVAKVEMLHSYGISALVKQWNGNNAHKLLKLAKEEARINASFTFGFSMDAPKNAIGSTGWDLLKGDYMAGISRTIASGSTEGGILAKMYGIK